MANTIKAYQEYERRDFGHVFLFSDISDIIKESECVADAIAKALEAGYMIGYKRAQRDARKRSRG